MESNILEDKIDKLFDGNYLVTSVQKANLLSLIEDVAVKFDEWCAPKTYAELSKLVRKKELNYKVLFTYFIKNIYGKQ